MAMLESEVPAFHGYARNEADSEASFRPPLTIAISREAGARGRTVAKRTAKLLEREFVSQETLEYMAENSRFQDGMKELSEAALEWIERSLADERQVEVLGANPELEPLMRVILGVAARCRCVLLGRGAGCVLPTDAKLHVRLYAPEKERITYLSQLERLSWTEAEKVVRERDEARRRFVSSRFGRAPGDLLQYDLALNTAQLGSEATAQIIVAAANAKEEFLRQRDERRLA